jgi:hypothetical protein
MDFNYLTRMNEDLSATGPRYSEERDHHVGRHDEFVMRA